MVGVILGLVLSGLNFNILGTVKIGMNKATGGYVNFGDSTGLENACDNFYDGYFTRAAWETYKSDLSLYSTYGRTSWNCGSDYARCKLGCAIFLELIDAGQDRDARAAEIQEQLGIRLSLPPVDGELDELEKDQLIISLANSLEVWSPGGFT